MIFVSIVKRAKKVVDIYANGTIALNQIIELAKVQNKDLSLEVIGENIARDLYERLGFKTHYRRMILKINDDIYEN